MTIARQMRIHAYGGPEMFSSDKVELPEPGPGEVLVRQHAAGVNFIDVYHRKGVFPIPALPGAIGVEAAGEVVVCASDVSSLKPGDRVAYAGPPVGSYADMRVMKAKSLVLIPETLSFEEAASIMLKGMTVHMLMTRVRPLSAGQTILVHSAAGGLGQLLGQWASSIGVRVIGTVGSAEKAEIARESGCSETILYNECDFVDRVQNLTDGSGVDAVFEGLGGDILTRSLNCLKPFGHAINLGQVGKPLDAVALADLGPQRSLTVSVPGVFAHLRTCPDLQEAADEMFAQVTSGAMKPRIGERFALSNVAAAHAKLEAGRTAGAIVLLP
ncbi:quinone oxidoreductase [Hoeflea sp.]|uniref:quinone oxidoreductase family protein n=1 Tax=Hoeflea sp. TaxID=1940281 RepID=UPI0019A9ED43|nr:quinone oxidoreductase [Hoeflea sp.]MBC7282729.1 quinone oxidoreductase [Hoeflea sp.]